MSDYAPGGPFDINKLAAVLQEEYRSADSYRDVLAEYEEAAFRYYEARPFGNEVEGRSQIVLPDVQEVVDYMTQSVLRTFISGDRTVEFEAVDESDVHHVEDATAAINWTFMRRQDGYRILHDGLQDGLLRKLGIFKTCKETVESVTSETVTVDPLMIGEMPDDIELEGELQDNGDGTVTAKIKTTNVQTRFYDYSLAPANFRFSPRARHEDEADYLCHVDWQKTRSDLVEMGFDKDQVYRLPCHSRNDATYTESDQLDQTIDVESTHALDRIELCEEYARIDLDGDGIAERVKVYRVDNQILLDAETGEPSIEVVDNHPFAVFCPYPRAHRIAGYSLAEKVMDIQLARSFGARQLFDGMAFANTPRPVVDMTMADENTIEDILNPIPGGPIRVKGLNAVTPYQTGFDIGKSLSAMEWLAGERESRTGITRMNQGLDADAMNKTATGTAMMQAAGQQQEEYIARNFAETLSRLFVKKYKLMRKEAEPFSVKVDGQFRQVDPSQWPDDINVTVRVGLGTGSKDKRVQARMALAEPLSMAVQSGFAGHKHVFKWFDGIARDTGIGQGDDFCTDPSAPPEMGPDGQPIEKQEQLDPELVKAQAEAQQAQAKLQGEQALQSAKLDMQREEAAQKQRLAREQAEFEAQLARDKAETEAALAQRKMAMEMDLAQQRMTMEGVMAANKAEMAANRPGGSLAE